MLLTISLTFVLAHGYKIPRVNRPSMGPDSIPNMAYAPCSTPGNTEAKYANPIITAPYTRAAKNIATQQVINNIYYFVH